MNISDSNIILGRILQVLGDQGYAQTDGYNKFELIKIDQTTIKFKRQKGTIAKVPLSVIIKAIDYYKNNPAAYEKGPAELRKAGIKYITSPTFALLHLVNRSVYQKAS